MGMKERNKSMTKDFYRANPRKGYDLSSPISRRRVHTCKDRMACPMCLRAMLKGRSR